MQLRACGLVMGLARPESLTMYKHSIMCQAYFLLAQLPYLTCINENLWCLFK